MRALRLAMWATALGAFAVAAKEAWAYIPIDVYMVSVPADVTSICNTNCPCQCNRTGCGCGGPS